MAPNSNTIFISGNLSVADWFTARDETLREDTPEAWQSLFDAYFQQRLERRYFKPIETLRAHDTKLGEGFSITAILCTLIEFLAANRRGKIYRHAQPETAEFYSNSKDLFIAFLATELPFCSVFDASSARSFYENVRCGLLHEARTKGGWTIWADAGTDPFVDTKDRVVYRNDLQAAIVAYVARARAEIATDKHLQTALVRTFNGLSQE